MVYDPRSLRPAQRGRHGVLALLPSNRPTPEEMAFDKVELWVPGYLHSLLPEAIDPLVVLDTYRETLSGRGRLPRSGWTAPGNAKASFETKAQGWGTISSAKVHARWADDPHNLAVTLTINPTRTLAHAISQIGPNCSALDELDRLSFEDFFARYQLTTELAAERTLDNTDNSLIRPDIIIERLGADAHALFIGVFEQQLRKWILEAVAPVAAGFRHDATGALLAAVNAVHRVALDWSRMSVRYAEVYCERRHGDAVGLMDRLASTVLAAHREQDWRTYPIGEIGGRNACSTTIGVRPTSRIEQVYYAKKLDRIRIETRYKRRLRDNFRHAPATSLSPLQDTLRLLQNDACSRIMWASFCAMAKDPPVLFISDASRLMGVIARCAYQANVDPEPSFTALFGTGGIEEGSATSNFPRRLIKRLIAADVIDKTNLNRRCRPGETRRYHLVEPFRGVALAMQQTFGSVSSDTTAGC